MSTAFPDSELEAVDALIEHVNGRHADTVALVARIGAGPAEGSEAEIALVDRSGVTIAVGAVTSNDRPTVRVPFAEPVGTAAELQTQMLAAVQTARSMVGEELPLTSLERESSTTAAIPMHRATVLSVDEVTPALLRVDLGGLVDFEILGPDTFAYALISGDGTPLDPGFTMSEYQEASASGRVKGAYYTVRAWDPDRSVLTLWVAVHGHGDGLAAWMQSAQPGDELLLWGPRRGFVPPDAADHLLLVADETGFAAVAAIIDAASDDLVIEAVLETVDHRHRPPLPPHPGLTVHWVDRGVAPAGAGEALIEAVAAIDTERGTWAAFGGCESRLVTRIRKLVRHERGLPAAHVSMTGYWRLGS